MTLRTIMLLTFTLTGCTEGGIVVDLTSDNSSETEDTNETDGSVDSDLVDTDDTDVISDTGDTDIADTDEVDTDLVDTDTCIDPSDCDGDGVTAARDCDDHNDAVSPLTRETCNGVDDDCDGTIDDGVKTRSWQDRDGDGFGNAAVPSNACGVPSGYVRNDDDCDDRDVYAFPGGVEVDNGRDDDCDGTIDDGFGGIPVDTDVLDTDVLDTDSTDTADTADTADTGEMGDTGDTAVEDDTDVVDTDTEPADTDASGDTDANVDTDEVEDTDLSDTDTTTPGDTDEADTDTEDTDLIVDVDTLACAGSGRAADACIVDGDGDGHAETLLLKATTTAPNGTWYGLSDAPDPAWLYENRAGCWNGDAPTADDVVGINSVGYHVVDFTSLDACITEMTLVSNQDPYRGAWWQNQPYCLSGSVSANNICAGQRVAGDYLLALDWDGVDLVPNGVGR